MGNNIQELIEQLYNMVKEAWGLPLSADKCVIERDKALDIIEEIKNALPNELAEAKRLVDAKVEFIASAKRDADTIKKAAEDRAKQLVNEQEVYRVAKAKSSEVMSNTEKSAEALKKAANDYVETTLRRTEEAVSRALDELKNLHANFQSAATGTSKAQQERVVDIPVDEE